MKYRKIIQTAVCVLAVCISVCTAGCSLSFCGFQIGGREELTFSCEEGDREETDEAPVSRQEESGAQPSERQDGSQAVQPSEGQEGPQEPVQPSEEQGAPQEPVQPSEGQEGLQEPVQSTGGPETGSAASDGKVNINSAGVEELMTLNGIGETRARAIIEYRTQYGAFTKEEDIMQVPGIKEGIYSKIQNQIAVY